MLSRESKLELAYLVGDCGPLVANIFYNIFTTNALEKNFQTSEEYTHLFYRMFVQIALHTPYAMLYLNNRLQEIDLNTLNDLSTADFYKMLTKELCKSALEGSVYTLAVIPASDTIANMIKRFGFADSFISEVILSVLENDNITRTI